MLKIHLNTKKTYTGMKKETTRKRESGDMLVQTYLAWLHDQYLKYYNCSINSSLFFI